MIMFEFGSGADGSDLVAVDPSSMAGLNNSMTAATHGCRRVFEAYSRICQGVGVLVKSLKV